MRVENTGDILSINFEEKDLFIAVEVEKMDEEEFDYFPDVYKSFPLDQFAEAVKFYLHMKQEYPDETVTFKILSRTKKHSILLHIGDVDFVSIKVSTEDLESDVLKKFEKVMEIIKE